MVAKIANLKRDRFQNAKSIQDKVAGGSARCAHDRSVLCATLCLSLSLSIAHPLTAQTAAADRSQTESAVKPGQEDIAEALRQLEALPIAPVISVDAWNAQVTPLLDKILRAPDAKGADKAAALLAAADRCPEQFVARVSDEIALVCRAYPEEALRPNLEIKRVSLLDRVDPRAATGRLQ